MIHLALFSSRQFPNGTVVEMDDCWMAVDTDRFQENPSINWYVTPALRVIGY